MLLELLQIQYLHGDSKVELGKHHLSASSRHQELIIKWNSDLKMLS